MQWLSSTEGLTNDHRQHVEQEHMVQERMEQDQQLIFLEF
jgi:hypothetical protein